MQCAQFLLIFMKNILQKNQQNILKQDKRWYFPVWGEVSSLHRNIFSFLLKAWWGHSEKEKTYHKGRIKKEELFFCYHKRKEALQKYALIFHERAFRSFFQEDTNYYLQAWLQMHCIMRAQQDSVLQVQK